VDEACEKNCRSGRDGRPGNTGADILGFGAAFTDASCFTLSRLSIPIAQPPAHHVRPGSTCPQHGPHSIGASDYSTAAYSYDDGAADPDLKRFSIDHDPRLHFANLTCGANRELGSVFVRLTLESSRMDEVQQLHVGGNIRPENIPTYARYFRGSWRSTRQRA